MYTIYLRAGAIVLATLLVALPAAAQSTRYVAPSGADASDCTDSGAPCATIAYALSVASDGDELLLAAGVYLEGDLVVDKDLTLTGAGPEQTIIDARTAVASSPAYAEHTVASSAPAPHVRVFTVDASVRMEGLTITGGGGSIKNYEGGGGILNRGDLTLVDCAVRDNYADNGFGVVDGSTAPGGGIANEGVLTIENCSISGNESWAEQGGEGGGIYNNGTMWISDSRITENRASDSQGRCIAGGIYNLGTAVLTRTTVSENILNCFEGGNGGGIANYGKMTIEASLIADNYNLPNWEDPYGWGGGIYHAGSDTLWIVNTTITGNTSSTGGGIHAAGYVNVRSSTIVGNATYAEEVEYPDYGGGGVYGDVHVVSSIVAGNTLEVNGIESASDCFDARSYLFASLTGADCTGDANLVVDASTLFTDVLEPLADNGGPTHTFALREAGPAVDAGTCALAGTASLATDQRGEPRPSDVLTLPNAFDGCDMGAFEFQAPPPLPCAEAVIRIDAFDADQGPNDTHEWVRLRHDAGAPVDFGGCHLAAVLGRTDRSTYTTPLAGVVAPGEALLVGSAAVPEVDIVIPNNTLHDARSGIYVLSVPMPKGTRPFQVASAILAGVTYYDEDDWYAQYPAPAGTKQAAGVEALLAGLAEAEADVPAAYALEPNYPNPFNPQTTIRFALPEAGQVVLEIFDLSGRLITRLVEQPMAAGRYEVMWDGHDAAGRQLASGLYLLRIRANDFTAARRMMLVK